MEIGSLNSKETEYVFLESAQKKQNTVINTVTVAVVSSAVCMRAGRSCDLQLHRSSYITGYDTLQKAQ